MKKRIIQRKYQAEILKKLKSKKVIVWEFFAPDDDAAWKYVRNEVEREYDKAVILSVTQVLDHRLFDIEIPFKFLQDAVRFTRMFECGSVSCAVHGEELQEEMIEKYPDILMQWLFDEVGIFQEN